MIILPKMFTTLEDRKKAFEEMLGSIELSCEILPHSSSEVPPESALALEMLGSAVDHIADQLIVDQSQPISPSAVAICNAEIEAIEMLLAVSRVLYLASPRKLSLKERFQRALQGLGSLVDQPPDLEPSTD